MLLPPSCPVCDRPGPAPCQRCQGALPLVPGLPLPAGLDRCWALLAYGEGARDLLTGLKYRNRRDALPWLADRMAAMYRPAPGATVTWPPTTAARRRERGYDQAELLARAVARRWGAPCRALLRRRGGGAQTGRARAARLAHPGFALRWPGASGVPQRVVLVDDVATTGATLSAAARALRAAGAREVDALVAARTPALG